VSTIKVRFFDMDKDGLTQIAINQGIAAEHASLHRYREVGHIKIAYKPRTSPDNVDALEVALENKRAFTVAQFCDWVTKNLKKQKLEDIVTAIDFALDEKYKRAGVIIFGDDR
jgi:hypothetical protein